MSERNPDSGQRMTIADPPSAAAFFANLDMTTEQMPSGTLEARIARHAYRERAIYNTLDALFSELARHVAEDCARARG